MKRNLWQSIPAALGLLVLIFDGALALEGARNGIDLCIRTVIPALFPFLVLSIVLTRSLSETRSPPVEFLSGILSLPHCAGPVLIPAFLGGYPVGAKCVADLYRRNGIQRAEAERMLAFCSNAGPSFLFGMTSGFFPESKQVWLLWFIQIAAAFLTAAVIPAPPHHPSDPNKAKAQEADILLSAARAMGIICCWVILFRILITFLERWFLWLLPAWAQIALMGFLELTNGCCGLALIADERLRFVVCSCMLAFGGICVLLQTASVTKGLSLSGYLKGKLMQTVFSLLLSSMAVLRRGWILGLLIPFLMIIFRKTQNRYGNPRLIPV